MIGARSFGGDGLDCEEIWKKVRTRRESPRKVKSSARERYERDSPLSPLRSPIRPDLVPDECTRSSRRRLTPRDNNRRPDRRQSPRKAPEMPLRSKENDTEDASGHSCWKVSEGRDKHKSLGDDDFPSLDSLRFTPEPNSKLESKDWGDVMEDFENDKTKVNDIAKNRPKRRLLLSEDHTDREGARKDQRPSSGSWHRRGSPDSGHPSSLQSTPTKRHKAGRFPSVDMMKRNPDKYEADDNVLLRRQKQVDLGKMTAGYDRYSSTVPRIERTRNHPRTPNKYMRYSRRSWDAQIKIWRRQLHDYDPPSMVKKNDSLGFSDCISDTTSEGSLEVSTASLHSYTDSDGQKCALATPPNSQASDNQASEQVFLDDLMDAAIHPHGLAPEELADNEELALDF